MNAYLQISSPDVLFVADTHFRNRSVDGESERRRCFYDLLAGLPDYAEVFLLGDIFDFYFEYGSVVTKRYFDVFQAFYDCSQRGVKLHFLGGNHDYWVDADSVRERFSAAEIPLLDNTRRLLTADGWTDDSDAKDAICIAGLGDLWTDSIEFNSALKDVPETTPRLLLSHNPDTAELPDAGRYRVDAMLAGHTHGGQVYVPGILNPFIPSRYGTKYKGGWCEGPQFPVLVSQGIGLAGMPVRIGVPPEFSLITIKRRDNRIEVLPRIATLG